MLRAEESKNKMALVDEMTFGRTGMKKNERQSSFQDTTYAKKNGTALNQCGGKFGQG